MKKMKKLTAIFLTLISMAIIMTGCEADSWSGTFVIETSTSTSWSISWDSMNGTMSQKLKLNGEDTLEYSVSGDVDNVAITLKQGDISKELSLDETEVSLEDFENGNIKIHLEVTDADECELDFELK